MKKVILSAAIIAVFATACTKQSDAPAKKTETEVYITLSAPDNDGITTTTTENKKFTVKY
jgi:hypothetical protein